MAQSMFCPSPLGMLRITGSPRGISKIELKKGTATSVDSSATLNRCVAELQEYFNGKRTAFTVPLDLEGTAFQKNVWKKLLTVGFGKTLSYGEIAKAIGKPRAFRAVGTAVGRNPVGVIVPCHRVLPSTGDTGNYAWGKARKKWLLTHEGSNGA